MGHDAVVERFRRSLSRGRLASTFLFVGPPGVGKRSFALKLAQAMLCQTRPEELLDPCGVCPGCAQVLAGTHPDLMLISKPPDKSAIPVAAFIGDDAHRMREGLCHAIALKAFMGGRKVAIIDDADFLNEESANCLLKTLEEPPPRSVLILIGTSADRQLPTIRSRSQVIRFSPLPAELVEQLLLARQLLTDPARARRLAEHCEGSLERALELADDDLWAFREQLLSRLGQRPLETVALGKAIGGFVDEAGKEATARRARARQVVGFAAELLRQSLRAASGLAAGGDDQMRAAAERFAAAFGGDPRIIERCLERTLDALGHIDRNANQATLIESWIDDLGQITLGRPVEPLVVSG